MFMPQGATSIAENSCTQYIYGQGIVARSTAAIMKKSIASVSAAVVGIRPMRYAVASAATYLISLWAKIEQR